MSVKNSERFPQTHPRDSSLGCDYLTSFAIAVGVCFSIPSGILSLLLPFIFISVAVSVSYFVTSIGAMKRIQDESEDFQRFANTIQSLDSQAEQHKQNSVFPFQFGLIFI